MTEALLEMKNRSVGYFSDLNILSDLAIKAHRGKIATILGANGVDKPTVLKAEFGFLHPNQGGWTCRRDMARCAKRSNRTMTAFTHCVTSANK